MIDIMNAAGWIKTLEGVQQMTRSAVQTIVVGSFTPLQREGNPGNTFWNDPISGTSLNSMGLPNGGLPYLDTYLRTMVQTANNVGKKLVVSIAGFRPAEYGGLAKMVFECGADGVEVNLGCPNVWGNEGQKPIASFSPELVKDILEHVLRRVVADGIQLSVKLSPFSNPLELEKIATLLADYEHTGLSVVTSNTFPNGFQCDSNGVQSIGVGSGLAGVSGPALKQIVLGQVIQFRQLLPPSIKVIGVGGIRSGQDMRDFEYAGASAIQVGTAFFADDNPRIFSDILEEYIALV